MHRVVMRHKVGELRQKKLNEAHATRDDACGGAGDEEAVLGGNASGGLHIR